MFSKYQWFNQELHNKSQKYNYITLVMAVGALICLFLLPQGAKMLNIPFIVVGGVLLYLNMRIQTKDKLMKIAQANMSKNKGVK